MLPEAHATSSGLKSLTTTITAEGIGTDYFVYSLSGNNLTTNYFPYPEVCRKACGGHGYTHSGGLTELYANYVGVLTAEGENFLLTQQTGRYLLKAYEKLRRNAGNANPDTSGIKYLEGIDSLLNEKCGATKEEDFLHPQTQLRIYMHCCARLLHETSLQMFEEVKCTTSLNSGGSMLLTGLA